jgi:putative spermidine/putrescine transport system ATP-binding protein
MATLTLQSLGKSFGTTAAVTGVDLVVGDGELVCLLGPSGSGKSTVLRMVGGFEGPTAGRVLIDGQDVTHLPPERRPTSMMFQSHALWSHMTVAGNIGFGLRLRGLSRADVAQRVDAALDTVGLPGYGPRRTDQLSGGQAQRVALARSLVLEPKILLLDEPFASLDQHLRERLREEVRDLQKRLRITMVFVTHGQDEALALADRIVVMDRGRVQQADRPDRLYRAPATPFVAGFIGQMNLIAGEVAGGRFVQGAMVLAAPVADGPALLAVRPEALAVSFGTGAGRLHRVTDFGSHAVAEIDLPEGTRVKAHLPEAPDAAPGMPVTVTPRRHTLYRDDRVLWVSDTAPGAAPVAVDA